MKQLLYLLLFIPFVSFGQSITNTLLTPTGSVKSFPPNITLANNTGTETSLIGTVKDTIKANSLVPYRPYRFELSCIVTTPLLSLPSLALKVKLGGVTVAMTTATPVLQSLTNAGIRVRGTIVSTGIASQIVLTEIIQPNGGVINLSNSNASFYSALSVDMSTDQVMDITAQWSGFVILGTASIKSVYYYRPDF